MTKLKAKDILRMDAYSIRKEAESGSAKQIFRALKNSLDSRIRTFAKHGSLDAVPDRILNVGGVKGKSDAEILQGIRDMSNFMRNEERGTYKQWRETQDERMDRMEDVIGDDYEFESDEDYEDMRRFLGEMQDRFGGGEMWKEVSGDAAQLWGEAKRLNLDPRQFLRNYEYWSDHVDDLKNAAPIQSDRKLYPSDYARKLGLAKVTGGRRSGSGKSRRSKKR